ncbi:MAG: hypothetical protein J6S02_01900 [Bacteroidaceae bacterium]|nr:hypothetical protein [Bacteroidaceae bacterium]
MKKTYITPATSTKDLQLEGLIAASIKLNNDPEKTVDTSADGVQLGNQISSPWSSSNWENN